MQTNGYAVHQPLQRRELDSLEPLAQLRRLLLYPSLRFLKFQFLHIGFLADASFLKIQV
jgi:Ser/Thr protein kinase RdoA (MazF antagonist)